MRLLLTHAGARELPKIAAYDSISCMHCQGCSSLSEGTEVLGMAFSAQSLCVGCADACTIEQGIPCYRASVPSTREGVIILPLTPLAFMEPMALSSSPHLAAPAGQMNT